ncbi:MAG: ABC transporter permease [Rhodocyclaceae bacterium]|nr:ABC transporter permease [Rhodocyclaceae bacterium]MBX3671140.1 ABC transporter permease [Rhodocyclaceae bacterium]
MRAVPLAYSLRNLWTRRLTTVLTAGGMALVVFVFAAVLMLDQGLKDTLVATGAVDNAVLIRRGSGTEIQSGIERAQIGIVEAQPQVALGAGGTALASREVVVLIGLAKRGAPDSVANVVVRGVGAVGLSLRPQLRITEGREFRPGSDEIIVAHNIRRRFEGADLGQTLSFGGRSWRIVGLFDAGGSGFDSEVWGDADQFMQAFRRNGYSALVVKLNDPEAFDAFLLGIESDPRLTVEAKREPVFYADQSQAMSTFLTVLGLALSIIFSVGAVIGAMITMYAAVAARVGEIGTLRALGFRAGGVLLAFLLESLLLSLVGAAVGLAAASLLQTYTVSTMNFQSFSELAFGFRLTTAIVLKTLAFSLVMGLAGGLLPALRAARMNIVEALRAA